MELGDWRDNPITVGCLIVYPQRLGSRLWVVEARVLEVIDAQVRAKVQPLRTNQGWMPADTPPVWLSRLDRVTVVG